MQDSPGFLQGTQALNGYIYIYLHKHCSIKNVRAQPSFLIRGGAELHSTFRKADSTFLVSDLSLYIRMLKSKWAM